MWISFFDSHLGSRQSGNVLFLILIAVALFAALSYAVTQSTRNGSDSGNEKTQLEASALLSYANELTTAAMRLKISNNCASEQLSFESPPYNETNIYTQYPNANAPANKSCHFFHPAGGAVSPRKASEFKSTIGMTYTAACQISTVSYQKHFVIGVGGISDDTCKAVNKMLGYNAPSFEPNQVPYVCSASHFTGDLTPGGLIVTASGTHPAGCIIGTGSASGNIIGSGTGQYWFYSSIAKQ